MGTISVMINYNNGIIMGYLYINPFIIVINYYEPTTIPSRHLPHPRVHPQRHVRHASTTPKVHGGELGSQ